MIYKHQLSHTKWVLIDSLYSHNNRDVIINKNENSFYYINTTSIPILSYTTIIVYLNILSLFIQSNVAIATSYIAKR